MRQKSRERNFRKNYVETEMALGYKTTQNFSNSGRKTNQQYQKGNGLDTKTDGNGVSNNAGNSTMDETMLQEGMISLETVEVNKLNE
jgi:hypothetical protein